MCHFLSALVTRTGEVLTLPEYTDSHEDLVDYFNLEDDGQKFCRVEFTPEAGPEVVDGYDLKIDEPNPPSWLDDEMKAKVKEDLKRKVALMLVADNRKILIGGCHILCDGAEVRKVIGARIIVMLGSSKVGVMWESSQVGAMWGSSQVGEMRESSKVGVMWESSQVGAMWGSSKVGVMWESSQVGAMWGSSKVGAMWGSSKVGAMWESSQVGEMRESSQVGAMKQSQWDNPKILNDERKK